MINLQIHYELHAKKMTNIIWNKFGLETAYIALDFLKKFTPDFYQSPLLFKELFHQHATENTSDDEFDLCAWLMDGNSCIKYVNNILQNGMVNTSNYDFNILNIINTAQHQEIYDALLCSFNEIKNCVVAKYLLDIGYKQFEVTLFESILKQITQENCLNLSMIFENISKKY